MLAELGRSLQKRGVIGTVRAASFGLKCQRAVRGKRGLEIGGPSEMFRRMIPVYPGVASLDNCVFATDTIWEGRRDDGAAFNFYEGKVGRNFVRDAVEVNVDLGGKYEFILACHVLEHIANPIKALKNWHSVAPVLLLILPYYRETFDHRRPVTTFDHMLRDFTSDVGEDDQTHIQEALELSDLSRVKLPAGMTLEEAKLRANPLENATIRCVHHHVFNEHNSSDLLNYCGYRVVAQQIQAASVCLLASCEPRCNRKN
jgi:hypothetical protein